MENKKQLVIVTPLSEPLRKLNKVLESIASDENIEISLIDETKELTQFIGSTGQCLVAFANAKKCATFLQENRFVLAKTHSKVILLTPKEIPAKTLVKFVKLGLTEAILDNSPPKTLLYKVKLLLRSIKSQSSTEEKDQVIKSIIDLNQNAAKSDSSTETDKTTGVEESLNYLADEKAKNKKNHEENAIDYGEGLKGQVEAEETIDTHWKSKIGRVADDSILDSDTNKIKNEESDIDLYYRGTQKKENAQDIDQSDVYAKKPKNEVSEDDSDQIKKPNLESAEIDLGDAKNDKNKSLYEEDDSLLSLKKIAEVSLDLKEEDLPVLLQTEEEKALQRQKDFDELDALFLEAKKRQAQKAEELGGHYKGEILNNSEEEDEQEIIEKKEYDNSELHKKEKSVELDLVDSQEDFKKKKEEILSSKKDPHEGQVDHIETNMAGESKSSEEINSNKMSDISNDSSKKISTIEIVERKRNSTEGNSGDADSISKKKQDQALMDSAEEKEKKTYDVDAKVKKKDFDLDLLVATNEDSAKEKDHSDNESDSDSLKTRKETDLKLVEDELKSSLDNLESKKDINYKKLEKLDSALDNNGKETHEGKVDKIDTYFRGITSKKSEQNWDNLTGKENNTHAADKANKKADEVADYNLLKKDAGETTIDYRKLKDEFQNGVSRGDSLSENSKANKSESGSLIEDDESSSKVIIVNAKGFDFGIEVLNLIYQKETKALDFYKLISQEMINKFNGYTVFYTYKVSENKHSEAFDSFLHFSEKIVKSELKEWWHTYRTLETQNLDHYFNKTMNTWLCREIADKAGTGFWEDVELPSWAENELTNKKVELIFPYFDGLDRMGVAVVFFPDGFRPTFEKSLIITLELARTVLLDSIQRKITSVSTKNEKIAEDENNLPEGKKKNIFSSFFNRKKAG